MLRILIPTCVIYAYSIIIPIVKWDIFEDMILDPNEFIDYDPNKSQNVGIYT